MIDSKLIIEFFEVMVVLLRKDSKDAIKEYMPKVLYANDLFLDIAYSDLSGHYIVNFTRSFDRQKSEFTLRSDDVFNHFDKTGLWQKFKIKGGLGIVDNQTVIWDDPRNWFITGGKPFHIQGKNNMVILDTFPINIPVIGSHIIEFALVISKDRLEYYVENETALPRILRDIYFYRSPGMAFKNHIGYLSKVNEELLYLITHDVNELRFDVLFQKNPLILEIALNIKALESQINLPDIHGQYNQDFRPDLLAFDELNQTYSIVDYKRADMKTNKKFRKVGTTFTASVNDLIHQIELYRGYFDDYMQREKIKEIYGYDIVKPKGIGVIGKIETEGERLEFNKCIAEYGKDIQLVTYTNIYEAVNKYIQRLKELAN